MTRSLSKTAGILLGMMILCTVPAHGQIVSYVDSGGKRVFINADPPAAVRQVKASLSGAGLNAGTAQRTTQVFPRRVSRSDGRSKGQSGQDRSDDS